MPVLLLRCLIRSLNAPKRLLGETRGRPALMLGLFALLTACGKPAAPEASQPVDVTVTTVAPRDTPVDFEFVAQTQSSRAVEIRARVDGFLDKRAYTEGEMVRQGQTLFLMDPKPFEAALQSAQGALAQQQARLGVAKANLARVVPLAAQNALSKKDLDDATGSEREAAAAVIAAKGQVEAARLNLGYTTIKSPLAGLSSYARQQEGSYVTPAQSGLLTYVYQMDPMWVEFSISENEMLRYRDQISKGQLRFPANDQFEITLLLADGSTFPARGRIDFANPVFSAQTGTFLVRAVFANEKGALRPGQFVRARVSGAVRPNAVLLPQRAVQQGVKSHFVWTVDKDNKPRQRVVEMGEWQGDDCFINDGLRAGDRVVVDGALRLSPNAAISITGNASSVEHRAKVMPPVAQQQSEQNSAR
ncbi:membrane fusion protein, multidrug efflux system [Burkholderia sp. WP9]|uniref:efflux RND transporter periplasmic adaptor subunit n=1 Tax=Burkholderia sp. WP9 TaxID=1500263 RepID=UPI00089886E8|nr:efflux RND transporter periplasmic adaptor subunit [Burkholderia sp. WP9]SEF06654.1 membrane fusion protein, multidrug efflux system [Burkholderia sp. WP9]